MSVARRWLYLGRCSNHLKTHWLGTLDPEALPGTCQLAGPIIKPLVLDTAFPDILLASDVGGFVRFALYCHLRCSQPIRPCRRPWEPRSPRPSWWYIEMPFTKRFCKVCASCLSRRVSSCSLGRMWLGGFLRGSPLPFLWNDRSITHRHYPQDPSLGAQVQGLTYAPCR